jgi:probable O-glycosylation ligase (exosortase A-associated)
MRDIFFLLIIVLSFPVGVFRPYYGMLVYTWISYMYPHVLTYSYQTFPAAKWMALSTVAGTAVRGTVNTAPLRLREGFFMVLLWCTFTLSSLFAINSARAWETWQNVSKLIFMALLAAVLLSEQKKLRYLLLIIALSLGFYGLKGGLFSLTTGGMYTVWGPWGSILWGNNNIGLALNMALPFLWYLAYEERGFLKVLLYVMFVFTVPAIMFTYSRGSALTLAIVLVAIPLRARNRTLILAVLSLAALLAIPLIPDKFWDRQETVLTYETDGSAMSRIDNWKFCWTLALDRPFTGGGFEFNSRDTFARYAPNFLITYNNRTWDTHNIYFAILAAHGFPGLIMFLAMIISCYVSCGQMRRRARRRPELRWVISYCSIIEVSLLALLINGMVVNMEYFNLVYDLVAIVMCLRVVVRQAFLDTGKDELRPDAGLVPAMAS